MASKRLVRQVGLVRKSSEEARFCAWTKGSRFESALVSLREFRVEVRVGVCAVGSGIARRVNGES
jgi:hypothetical protein